MMDAAEYRLVRASVFAVVAAQGVFWLYTLSLPRNALAPVDLVILWLTVPSLFFGVQRDHVALGAGLGAASVVILCGLLL